MRLYARVTSERASKGQGGNEYLDIDITVGDAKQPVYLARLTVRPTENGYALYDENDEQLRHINKYLVDQKSKKQTGESKCIHGISKIYDCPACH